MWPDWVSNPGPLVLESDALPTALDGLALCETAFERTTDKRKINLNKHLPTNLFK